MGIAGDKVWKQVLRHINDMDDDDDLETANRIGKLLKYLNIKESLAEELQDILYDQLTQYTKAELLSDLQIAGPQQSMESYRKAVLYGKKKTSENVHRATNRVTRPVIAETMQQLEEKYKKWKKDIAYLKDINAYEFKETSMISILMDFIPDEAHKEISMKHETVGRKASSLRQIQIEVEKIIQRDKDRAESRKDRKADKKGVNAVDHHRPDGEPHHHHQHHQEEEHYVWD